MAEAVGAKIPRFKERAILIWRVGPPGNEERSLGIGRSSSCPKLAAIEQHAPARS